MYSKANFSLKNNQVELVLQTKEAKTFFCKPLKFS